MSLFNQLKQLRITDNQAQYIINLVNDSKDYNTFIANTPTGIRSIDNRINSIVEQHYNSHPRPSGGRKRKSRRNRKSKKARKSRRKSTRRR